MSNPRAQAEQIVLAGILDNVMPLEAVEKRLGRDGIFHFPGHSFIYDAMFSLEVKDGRFSRFALSMYLLSVNQTELAEYVVSALDLLVIRSDMESAMEVVLEEGAKRNIKSITEEVQEKIDNGFTAEEIVSFIQAQLTIFDSPTNDGIIKVRESIDAAGEEMIKQKLAEEDPDVWVPMDRMVTALDDLDKGMKGVGKGQVCILAARPGVGKTCLAVQAATECCARGLNTVFVSYEMSAQEIQERIILSGLRVKSTPLSPSKPGASPWVQGVETSISNLKARLKGELIILDDPALTDTRLKTILKRLHLRGQCDAIIIDYIQLMPVGGRKHENRQQEMTEVSRNIKAMARGLEVPILVLSQFNRRAAGEKTEPQLHDLRESGSLEQDADKVILMWEDSDNVSMDDSYRKLNLYVAKNRQGRRVRTEACFFPDQQIITDWRLE